MLVGPFYNNEIQKVQVTKNQTYDIEKVLQTKTVRGKKMFLVKWMYYPKKFNDWVTAKEMKDFTKPKKKRRI